MTRLGGSSQTLGAIPEFRRGDGRRQAGLAAPLAAADRVDDHALIYADNQT